MRKESSTNAINERFINAKCGMAVTLSLLNGRWKLHIIWHLLKGTLRYYELKKRIPDVTERMLVKQLNSLVSDGVVEKRRIEGTVPAIVEYSMSPMGESLKPLLKDIERWGNQHKRKLAILQH